MSQFGSGNTPAQASLGGQVTFFDPSKFQKGSSDLPNITASQPSQAPFSSGGQAFTSQADPSQSSWSSWGSWNGASNPYAVSSSTGQSTYVNSSTSQEANAYNANAAHSGASMQSAVTNDAQYNQQWYDQSQWNQAVQQPDQFQQHWDHNSQQWVQYDYSQVSDPNQYSGYNQYWAGGDSNNGVNGHESAVYGTEYQQQTGDNNQILQSANNYFMNDPRSHVAQNDSEACQESGVSTSATESSTRQETSDELDVSQSTTETTESESQSHSLGQYEESSLDGCFQHEDFVQEVQEEIETKVDHKSEQMHPPENEGFIPHIVHSDNAGNVIGQNIDSTQTGLEGPMEAVSLQENIVSQGAQGNFVPVFQPTVKSQSDAFEHPGHVAQPAIPMFSSPPTVGNEVPHKNDASSLRTDQPPPQAQQPSGESREHQTPTFSDWEMVPPQGKASHSRNPSADNNVHFFISSTNSSARVSPATSSKTGGDDPETKQTTETPGKSDAAEQVIGTKSQTVSGSAAAAGAAANLGPPPITLRPPSQGSNKGDNPFRKSPNTSMLSSTHMDVTKGNMDESEVILNRSLSPIAPTEELKSERQRQVERATDSPDIHMNQSSATEARNNTAPRKTSVPQSPILPRKESPFQPPGKIASDNRSKPLRASHDMPGVSNYVQRQKSDEKKQGSSDGKTDREVERSLGRKTPDWEKKDRKREGHRNPDMESSERRREGRKTPDWDSGNRKREGRKTPDWDSSERRREGRKTPDWDGGNRRREGRRTPDWDSSEKRREGRRTPEWDRSARSDRGGEDRRGDRLSGRPPAGPGDNVSRAHRSRQSAFHQYQVNRTKENVSPATSLWDTPADLSTVSNILLVPAAGASNNNSGSKESTAPSVLTPVASLITSMSEQIKTDDHKDNSKYKQKGNSERERDSKYDRDRETDTSSRSGYSRDKEKDSRDRLRSNRSYDSLQERDRGAKDSRNSSRERNVYGSRDSLDQDDSKDRSRRGDSRDRERGYRDRDSYYDRYR